MKKSEQDHIQWEAICKRCGRCCFEKIEYRGRIYLTDIPCEYLDLATMECTVYGQRCDKRDGCVALTPEIVNLGVLPGCCAYVQKIDDYVAPLSWDSLPGNVRNSALD